MNNKVTPEMVNRFLSWPLPETVCADQCATKSGHQNRTGTNLLTATEARAMLQHVLGGTENVLDFLERALPYIEQAGTINGYGFYQPENPNDFCPDLESCSKLEIDAHKAACEAWNRGEYKRDPKEESGLVGDVHILKSGWGIGSYSETSPEAQKLIDSINAILLAEQP